MTTKYESMSTAEVAQGAVDACDRMLARLEAFEQMLAEAGLIPVSGCPKCHDTGKVSIRAAEDKDALDGLRDRLAAAIESEVYEFRERTMFWPEGGVTREIARLATRGAMGALEHEIEQLRATVQEQGDAIVLLVEERERLRQDLRETRDQPREDT